MTDRPAPETQTDEAKERGRRDEDGTLVKDALDEARAWAAAADAEAADKDGSGTTVALLFSNASAWALISIAESVGDAGRARDIAQTEILLDKLQDAEGVLRARIRELERAAGPSPEPSGER